VTDAYFSNATVELLTASPPPQVSPELEQLAAFLAFAGPSSVGVVEPCDGVAGEICTVAGNGVADFTGDNVAATQTTISRPIELALTDWNGDRVVDLAIADWNNFRIRLVYLDVTTNGVEDAIVSLAGTGRITGADALDHPTDLAFAADGALLIAGWHHPNVYRYARGLANGADREQIAGLCDTNCDSDGSTRVDDTFLSLPVSIASHPDGRIFLAEAGCSRIRVLTVAGQRSVSSPMTCLFDINVFADTTIETLAGSSGVNGYAGDGGEASAAIFDIDNSYITPNFGIALSQDGDSPGEALFVADSRNHVVRRIDLSVNPPTIDRYVGIPETSGFVDGPADVALFNFPTGVYADTDGAVYVADTGNQAVRRIDQVGRVTTIAGTGIAGFNGDNRPATQARLNNPNGVVVHPDGRIFIADTNNNRIRVINP